MRFNEMTDTIDEAEITLRGVDRMTNRLAGMVSNRLRLVSPGTLERMKRQLKNFNIQTGQWKD